MTHKTRTLFPKTFLLPLVAALALSGLLGCGTGAEQEGQPQQTPPPAQQEPKQEPAQEQPKPIPEQYLVSTDLLFPDKNAMNLYREFRSFDSRTEDGTDNPPLRVLEEWLKGPKNTMLTPLLPDTVKVLHVKDLGNKRAEVNFSKEILQANLGSSGEAWVLEAVPTMLKPFGYDEVVFLVDGQQVDSLAGHMTLDRPFKAKDLNEYAEAKQ